MKKVLTVLFILTLAFTTFAQYSVRGDMGIVFLNTSSLVDYINQNFASSNQQLGVFGSAVVFSGEFDYSLNNSHQLGLEVAYLINSYNLNLLGGIYKLDYNIVMPSLVYYYVIGGNGFNFKFGGGAGIRLANVNEQLPATQGPQTFHSTGFGLLARADGNTIISENLYVNVGLDLRYDLNGKPKNGNRYIVNYSSNTDVNLNALSVGLRLGLLYSF
jgi:hypothetical protein